MKKLTQECVWDPLEAPRGLQKPEKSPRVTRFGAISGKINRDLMEKNCTCQSQCLKPLGCLDLHSTSKKVGLEAQDPVLPLDSPDLAQIDGFEGKKAL